MIIIRAEAPEDYAAVRRVNALAFGREGEAALVDKLRAASPHISLVAVKDSEVVGHIFFSPATVESDPDDFAAVALGPMAVLPGHQNQGVGSQLVGRGLGECKSQGHDVVFVLGHPDYYPRFGFSPAAAKGIRCEYPVPDEVFMVAELRPGALGGRKGLMRYRPEFAEVE
ncbi:MAG TPA: N-acetyltransferase [Pyrinomonadaceae bacterium]|nr:N-acetyltransferase [Pyrinomonadaceae bacterium]